MSVSSAESIKLLRLKQAIMGKAVWKICIRYMCVITVMSTVQFKWLCACLFPPTTHLRTTAGWKRLKASWFLATTHCYPSVTGAGMAGPVPHSIACALPQPLLNPPAWSPPPPFPTANPNLPALLPDSMCKSAPWMMDYCVTAACEGLICFIDFSLGRMPASAASHLSSRLAAVIDGNGLRQINRFLVKIAPNNRPRSPACILFGRTLEWWRIEGVRFVGVLHLYCCMTLSFSTAVTPYPVLSRRRPSSLSNTAISLLYLQLPLKPYNGWVMTVLSWGGCGSWAILSQ